ncbi:MAG: helix-turn-helix domain-containing protein [Thaumarchaeota archaeon]|nr:helix-turn-helix domain-containing protein [Nitrososphaerota archaeon]
MGSRPADEHISFDKLYDLHWRRNLSLHQMAHELGINRRTLARRMKEFGVKIRTSKEAVALLVRSHWITPELLDYLYWNKKLSASLIGELLGFSPGYVTTLMQKDGIQMRTISEAGMKYPKHSFNGNLSTKAYLLGFRVGDLNGGLYGYQVRVATSTTHPAMWRLLNMLFGKSGRVGRSAAFNNGGYEWCLYCYLDSSFDFLLDKPGRIDESLLADDQLFLSFLAGYFDAEGSLRIYPVDSDAAYSLRINSEDEVIMRQIVSKLRSMRYHADFSLGARKNLKAKKRLNKNVWSFGMFRKAEILELITKLPLHHDEKTRMKSLMLNFADAPWQRVGPQFHLLKSRIRKEVISFRREAKKVYHGKARRLDRS